MSAVQFRRALVRADLERMNLPEEFWHAKVQGVSAAVRPALEKYLRRVDEMVKTGAGLMVCGAPGVGKTGVAALVLKEARARGYTAMFCRLWELREMLRSRMEFDAEMSVAERVREVDALVLDDLCAQDMTAKFFTPAEIVSLVKYRASRRRVTLVTTRMTQRDLDTPPMDELMDVLLLFGVTGPNLYEQRQRELKQAVLD